MKAKLSLCQLGSLVIGGLLTANVSFAADGDSWTDRITVSGDLRFRTERIDMDMAKVRTRQRIRARIGVDAEVDEDFSVHFRLASGNDDPVSTNQTLGDGFSTKDFGLDRAYFDWNLGGSGLHVMGGKMKNPVGTVKDLLFDSDLSPEGMAASYAVDCDMADITLNAAGLWGDERSASSDAIMWVGQAVADFELADDVDATLGTGYYYWDNTKGFAPLFDATDGFGNTLVVDGTGALVYGTDYGIYNVFAELGMDVGMPLKLYFDYVVNTEADTGFDEDQGFMLGLTLGKASGEGDWQLDYNYREVEADAVIGAFTDSDSGGGGSDIEGHRIQFKYKLANALTASGTLFVNNIGIASGGADTDYNRVQLDLIAKI